MRMRRSMWIVWVTGAVVALVLIGSGVMLLSNSMSERQVAEAHIVEEHHQGTTPESSIPMGSDLMAVLKDTLAYGTEITALAWSNPEVLVVGDARYRLTQVDSETHAIDSLNEPSSWSGMGIHDVYQTPDFVAYQIGDSADVIALNPSTGAMIQTWRVGRHGLRGNDVLTGMGDNIVSATGRRSWYIFDSESHETMTMDIPSSVLGNLWTAAWSPDGEWLVFGTSANELLFYAWETDSFRNTPIIRQVPIGSGEDTQPGIRGLAWSSDSVQLAVGGAGGTYIWNEHHQEGRLVYQDRVLNLAWNTQGTMLALIDHNHTVLLWENNTVLSLPLSDATALVWSPAPDEDILAVGTPASLTFWEVR